MKRLIPIAGLAALLAACSGESLIQSVANDQGHAPAAVAPVGRGVNGLTVMTMNTFYGADFGPLLTAPADQVPLIVAQTFGHVQLTDIPARAGRIAALIAANGADLVGLQEAAIYRVQHPGDVIFGNPVPATEVVYDFVALILDSLSARGLQYTLAAADSTTDIELPMFTGFDGGLPTFDDVRLTDRDAVLARVGLPISNPQHSVYQWYIPVDLGGFQTGVHEGWSSVDVAVGTQTWRFVATHLEYQLAPQVQEGQVQELIATFGQGSMPTILVGDFNSDASGVSPDKATPSYGELLDAGFVDTWTNPSGSSNSLGLTCCELDDLDNPKPEFDQRLDLILTRNMPMLGNSGMTALARKVVGNSPSDRTAGGLWPSDHAALVAQFLAPK